MKWTGVLAKNFERTPQTLHTVDAREIEIHQSGFSRREKFYCPDERKGIEIRQLFSLEMALNIHEMGFAISKTIPFAKSEKYEPFCVLNFYFSAKNGSPALQFALP